MISILKKKPLALGLVLGGLAAISGADFAAAQSRHTLYIGYWNSKNYHVGAVLNQSGLHRWEGDTTWVHLGWNTPRISGISSNPSNSNELFLASGNGVMRSRDRGASWKIVTDWTITEVQDVEVHAPNPKQIWAASAYGIFGSRDGGDTWQVMNNGISHEGNIYTHTVESDRTVANRVFAGGWDGLYESVNGGDSWKKVAANGFPVLDIQQSKSRPQRWIAATEKGGIWLSDDGAKTWTQVKGRTSGLIFYGAAIDPHNADRMAIGGWDTGVWITSDGGKRWTNLTKGLPKRNIYEVIYDADVPGRLWAATIEGGLFHTTDQGKTWVQAGLGTSFIFDMHFVEEK